MALFSKQTILYLTSKKAFFSDGKNKGALDWNGRDFSALFIALKTKVKISEIKIVLGNDLSYVITLMMPKTAKPEEIIAKANELIPEPVTVQNSVFKIHGQNENGESIVQVFAIPNQALQGILKAVTGNNIHIEYLSPAVSIISGALAPEEKPTLVIWSGEEQIALIAKNGVIYGEKSIPAQDQGKIGELIEYVKDHFGFKPTLCFANGDTKGLLSSKTAVKKMDFDLFSAAASHSISEDGQSDFLALKLPEIKKEEPQKAAPEAENNATNLAQPTSPSNQTEATLPDEKKPSPLGTIILIVVILGAIGYLVYQFVIKGIN